jgi:hypothetical protein
LRTSDQTLNMKTKKHGPENRVRGGPDRKSVYCLAYESI